MRIVVTGGAGFIGSHIVESLVNDGHQLTVFDNFSTGSRENLRAVIRDVEIVEGDIRDIESLRRAFRGADIVSHQAAQLEIFRSTEDPLHDLSVNTIGTMNVLQAARESLVQQVINASSACVYGQADGLTREDHTLRPNWAYGVSKLAAERYCDIYSDYRGLPVVNLRYSITYGEREWFRRVLTIFVKRAILGQPLVVFGDGKQVRDFIYVADVVHLHNSCLGNPAVAGQSYNAGTGRGTTIAQLAERVRTAAGTDLPIIFEETREGDFSKLVPEKRRNSEELKTMLLDVSKAERELHWRPSTSLALGLEREIAWARANLSRWERMLYTTTAH